MCQTPYHHVRFIMLEVIGTSAIGNGDISLKNENVIFFMSYSSYHHCSRHTDKTDIKSLVQFT